MSAAAASHTHHAQHNQQQQHHHNHNKHHRHQQHPEQEHVQYHSRQYNPKYHQSSPNLTTYNLSQKEAQDRHHHHRHHHHHDHDYHDGDDNDDDERCGDGGGGDSQGSSLAVNSIITSLPESSSLRDGASSSSNRLPVDQHQHHRHLQQQQQHQNHQQDRRYYGQNTAEATSPRQHHRSGSGDNFELLDHYGAQHIFDAIKNGLLVPVQALVEQEGPSIFSIRDEKGHTPAHWACLGGHTTILRFIIECKGLINEPSQNDPGARPIHWACVNGHIAVVDILVQAGVPLDVMDNKGCTPLTVAAQYGQTMLAAYLMGKGAQKQLVDKDGDNALHWAAFKGYSELMRLLIYSGFCPRRKDNYGQTPLHLACISGNLTAVKELCEQDGVEVDLPDKNGKTPLMLAMGRKHEAVISYLKRESKQRKSLFPRFDFWSILFGPPGNSKTPMLFLVTSVLFWGYPMYVFKCLPQTFYELQTLHIIFIGVNVVMWICLFHASRTEPGFLERNVPEYHQAIKQVAHFDEWKQGSNPLSRLCHTCQIVKPMRAKHCRICNRCVREFDHHCPYIYNCVGYTNRVWFFGFASSIALMCAITDYLCYYMLKYHEWNWLVVIGFCQSGIFTFVAGVIPVMTIIHAAMNLTTNERINYRRCYYLKDGKGNFYNPYNQGLKNNILEFLHLRHPQRLQDLEILNMDIV
ncbi:probable protein S-acyltransferase 23 isoform X2 [Octopus sinensis]|uniref:Palmitoyltransferase n=1 Tax=Octopus sinensis TaxID=2607531 RepID=A0A7E6EZS1_9MOLL|nr:probable protein S-acyltransferase 23 isoform X2 [Octopus sinensis]